MIDIVSHRCLGYGCPQNTFDGMKAALASKVPIIELDIRLTKDRKWVLAHDPFVEVGRKTVQISKTDYEQLPNIALLDEALSYYAQHTKKQLFLDVKDVEEIEQLVLLIKKHQLENSIVVISWEPQVLSLVHRLHPKIRIGMCYVPLHSTLKWLRTEVRRPISRHQVVFYVNRKPVFDPALSVGITHHHYLSTLPELPLWSIQVPAIVCSEKLVRLAHARGIRVYPFGVKTRVGAALLRRRGVDGLITDYPSLWVQ